MKATYSIETVKNVYNEEFRALKVTEEEFDKVFDERSEDFDYTYESIPGATRNDYKDLLHVVAYDNKSKKKLQDFLTNTLGNTAARKAISCVKTGTCYAIVYLVCDKKSKKEIA